MTTIEGIRSGFPRPGTFSGITRKDRGVEDERAIDFDKDKNRHKGQENPDPRNEEQSQRKSEAPELNVVA